MHYCKRLPYSALIISWRSGSIRLEAYLLFVFSRYSERKIRSIFVKQEHCRTSVIIQTAIHLSFPLRVVVHMSYICFQHDQRFTDSVEQLPPIYHVSVRVGGVIHTYEEGFWGPITCQQLHCSWIEPEPESHSQHQQARELKNCSSNPHYEAHNSDRSLRSYSRFYNLIDGQERVTTIIAGTTLSSTFFSID